MQTIVWGVKGLEVLSDALRAAEDMDSPQVIAPTSVIRSLVEKAEELWTLKSARALEQPRPFLSHLRDLEKSRVDALMRSHVEGLRRDNLLAASELREGLVERQRLQKQVEDLEAQRVLWTQATDWGYPGTEWSVDISGLLIPASSEADARRLASANHEAVALIREHTAWRTAPEVGDE